MSARSVSACDCTDTYSPAAIDIAPAASPATPAVSTAAGEAPVAATPTIRLAVEMTPSLAPSTAARSQPMRELLCHSAWRCGMRAGALERGRVVRTIPCRRRSRPTRRGHPDGWHLSCGCLCGHALHSIGRRLPGAAIEREAHAVAALGGLVAPAFVHHGAPDPVASGLR